MHFLHGWSTFVNVYISSFWNVKCKKHELELKFVVYLQVVPNLEELSLDSRSIKMIMQQQFPSYYFHKVKYLHLLCLHHEVFPFDILQNFASIATLHVGCSTFQDLLPYEFVDIRRKIGVFLHRYIPWN